MLKAAVVALVLLSTVAYALEQPSPTPSVNGGNQKPHAPESDAKPFQPPSGTDKIPFVVKSLEAEKTPERTEQERPERDEKFSNERSMVVWTIVLAVATIVLAFIAVGQLLMFLKQLHLMERGADDAKSLAKSARSSAIAARRQSEAIVNSERAKLFVEVALGDNIIATSGGARNSITVKIWNYGKTVANISMIRAYCLIQREAPTELIEFEGSDKRLPPGLGLASNCAYDEEVTLTITNDDWANIQGWNMHWYCVGAICYRDIFDKERETGFCWKYLWHMNQGRFIFERESALNRQT